MGIMKKDDTPGLFSALADRPLADRLRPSALEDIMGQDHLLGEGGHLRLMADSGKMTSFILWGPPGCGKTTLIRLINGLAPGYYGGKVTGSIHVAGIPNASRTLPEIAADCGTLFQDPENQFFALNVEDELAFAEEWRGTPREGIRRKIEDAVKRFGIGRVLSSSIHELSEGEKQKVGLSSITMTDPKALIFDEPTANLDPESTEALASEIIRLKKEGKAILVVDHRLYWLAGAVDRVIVMEDGRMAEEGDFSILTPELCRRYGLRSAAVPDVRETLPRNEEASGRPVLAADAVTFAYKGKAPVFDDATFGIHPGITAVIGHNGAGKTTLARLLTGLAKPVKGGFLLGGKQADAKTLLASVSIVLQNADHQLHMKTVLGEVMSSLAAAGRPAEREDALPLLSLFHLESLAERHPQSLSGGQKQRLVIALAFAKDPDVIILDEPTSGLDGVNMRRIARALESMAKEGKAVLVITHDLELLKLCCERRLTLPIRNEVLARAA